MVLPKGKYIVLWPEYFDSRLSRKDGRMVGKKDAVEEPTVDDLCRVLQELNIEFKVELEKAFPSSWWRRRGRVLVECNLKKSDLLKTVCKALKNIPRR
jgi:signal recognition particle subunit SRP19